MQCAIPGLSTSIPESASSAISAIRSENSKFFGFGPPEVSEVDNVNRASRNCSSHMSPRISRRADIEPVADEREQDLKKISATQED